MQTEMVTFGETMVLFEAETEGRFSYVPRFLKKIGGAESNVAIALKKLGHSTRWMSKVSDDEMGEYVVREIRAEGVQTEYVKKTTEAPTALYIKERRREDETAVYYYRHGSAASTLTKDDLHHPAIESAAVLHLTGITPLLSDSCYEAVLASIETARANDVFVSFDPNLRFALIKKIGEEEARERLLKIASLSDLVLPGLDEAIWLFGEQPEAKLLQHLIDNGAKKAVIKNGADYTLYQDEEGAGQVDSFTVSRVVDPIGAGDGFAAGVLAGLLEQKSLAESVKIGAAVGSLVVQSKGDVEGMPTRMEVDAILGENEQIYGGVVR